MNRRRLLCSSALLALILPQTGCRALLRQRRMSRRGGSGGGTPKGVTSYQIVVDGYPRTGFLHLPSSSQQPAPVIFVFHGHGGSASAVASSFGLHTLWPEAVVIYLQGLNTPSQLDPQGSKPGWQTRAGDQEDRDLHLFDAVLADLRQKHLVDMRYVFATGHSNGGFFTYLLWQARSRTLAAVAPSGATTGRIGQAALPPKPALHIAGTQDTIVKFSAQQQTMERVKRSNHCSPEGQPWAQDCILYPSSAGTPLITCIYSGGHTFPRSAPQLIVRFFQQQYSAAR